MQETSARTVLLVIGPIDQQFVRAAWKGFGALLSAVVDRELEWVIHTTRRWAVGRVRRVKGDPAGWRISTPKMSPRFHAAGFYVRPADVIAQNGYWVTVQKWNLQYMSTVIEGMPDAPISARLELLDALRRGLPLSTGHVWYLFAGMAVTTSRDVAADASQVHSFGYGNDEVTTWVGDGTDEFEQRFLPSLAWRIS